jgi:hypothetical protein
MEEVIQLLGEIRVQRRWKGASIDSGSERSWLTEQNFVKKWRLYVEEKFKIDGLPGDCYLRAALGGSAG